jgi:hypothetical protein
MEQGSPRCRAAITSRQVGPPAISERAYRSSRARRDSATAAVVAAASDAAASDADADDATGSAGAGAGASNAAADVDGDAGADGVAGHGFGLAAWAGGFGVTSRRHDERDAKMPWKPETEHTHAERTDVSLLDDQTNTHAGAGLDAPRAVRPTLHIEPPSSDLSHERSSRPLVSGP